MTFLRMLVGAFALSLFATAAHAVPTIDVGPGSSPAGYIPLTAFGTVPTGIGDEDVLNLAAPSFVYAGQSWTSVGVVSNGYLVVGGTSGAVSVNTDLPDPAAPKNILAPYWTDLDGTSASGIYANVLTDGVNSWLVVEWDVNLAGTTDLNVFQVWIGLNGAEDISFAYGTLTAPTTGNLTVGANDISGLIGDTYYFNGAGTLPAVGPDRRVTTTDLPVAVPEPGTIAMLVAGLIGLAGIRRMRRGAD